MTFGAEAHSVRISRSYWKGDREGRWAYSVPEVPGRRRRVGSGRGRGSEPSSLDFLPILVGGESIKELYGICICTASDSLLVGNGMRCDY